MNKLDLILKVFRNEPVERVPVGFWFHFLSDAETADGSTDQQIVEKNVLGHKAFIEAFKPDMVKIMSDGFFRYPSGSLKEPSDLETIQPIDSQHPWIRSQVRLVKSVVALQQKTPYFYNIFSPITTLRFMVGREIIVNWLKIAPLEVFRALERMGKGFCALTKAIIEEGQATGLYLSVQNPKLDAISDEFYQQYLEPSESVILDAANASGGLNILHICGYDGIRNRLEFFAHYKAQAFSWAVNVEKVTLAQGRALFGGRAVIGGFPNAAGTILHTGSKKDIEEFTSKLIKEVGKVGVIIGADCTIPSDTSLEHLEWVRKQAAL